MINIIHYFIICIYQFHLDSAAIVAYRTKTEGETVPVSKSRNIPKVVLVRCWAVGVLGIWRGGVGGVRGGAKGVSLQAT
jgi:hypothetical protein